MDRLPIRRFARSLYASAPERLRHRVRRIRHPAWLGTLRRTTPLSDGWGFERGSPVDRYYIERFVRTHRQDIRGRALEVMDSRYVDRFGSGVTEVHVLDIDPDNARATIVADLTRADTVPDESFDCIVVTQTLQLIFDVPAALSHLERMLKPGGVLLVTVPGISRIGKRYLASDHWRFTPASCTALFGARFAGDQVEVSSYGNVLAAMAFLSGMAREELRQRELDVHDPFFPVILGVRAHKAGPRSEG